MAQTAQLDLFASADAYRQLQTENAWLKAQLENAKTEFRKLREELQQCLQATQDALRLRRALEATNRECALWKSQAELSKMVADLVPHGAQPQLTAPRKANLTKLLVLCHPDKWSQGQPATELAHELTVQLNAWRERLEGRV
jgi:hypothetical protein